MRNDHVYVVNAAGAQSGGVTVNRAVAVGGLREARHELGKAAELAQNERGQRLLRE